MTHAPDGWPSTTWQSIATAPLGLPMLHATLDAARAVCDGAGPETPRSPDFDPATGWAHLDGVMAGLELAAGLAPANSAEWPSSIDRAEARSLLDELLRRAADVCLTLADELRAAGTTADLRAVAGVARQLPDTYEVTLGQPW